MLKPRPKQKNVKTKAHCVECQNCGDIIYSRTTHDMRYCRCGVTMVDGGFDYMHCGWLYGLPPITLKKYVNATKKDLYNDWNSLLNYYGNWSITNEKSKNKTRTKTKTR